MMKRILFVLLIFMVSFGSIQAQTFEISGCFQGKAQGLAPEQNFAKKMELFKNGKSIAKFNSQPFWKIFSGNFLLVVNQDKKSRQSFVFDCEGKQVLPTFFWIVAVSDKNGSYIDSLNPITWQDPTAYLITTTYGGEAYFVDRNFREIPDTRNVKRYGPNNGVIGTKLLSSNPSKIQILKTGRMGADGVWRYGVYDLTRNQQIVQTEFKEVNIYPNYVISVEDTNGYSSVYSFKSGLLKNSVSKAIPEMTYTGSAFSGEAMYYFRVNDKLIKEDGTEYLLPSGLKVKYGCDPNFIVADAQSRQGIWSLSGEMILPVSFDDISSEVCNQKEKRYYPVKKGNLWGYFDSQMQTMVTGFEYKQAGPFNGTTATVITSDGRTQTFGFGQENVSAKNAELVTAVENLVKQFKAQQDAMEARNAGFVKRIDALAGRYSDLVEALRSHYFYLKGEEMKKNRLTEELRQKYGSPALTFASEPIGKMNSYFNETFTILFNFCKKNNIDPEVIKR